MDAFAALVVDKANAMLAAPPPSTDLLTFELLYSLETSGAMDFSDAGARDLLAHMMVDACNEEQRFLEGNPDIVVMTPEDAFPGLCLQDMAEELVSGEAQLYDVREPAELKVPAIVRPGKVPVKLAVP